MKKRKILFLGETYRADAIIWMNGLKEFGHFEIICWELRTPSNSLINRTFRFLEFATALFKINRIIGKQKPDLVIAERTTSYGFLAAISNAPIIVIAQQGSTDLWPMHSFSYPLKKIIQRYAFQRSSLIHAWGKVMVPAMVEAKVDPQKILLLPKGIDIKIFSQKKISEFNKIKAIVTRSLALEYRHEIILKAFSILDKKGIDFELTFVGDGNQLAVLKKTVKDLQLTKKVHFLGRKLYSELPHLLQQNNFYISMPNTEGVSASLFEAMASQCYPIVSDIAGNQEWITNNQNGSLVPVDDFKELAQTILTTFEDFSYRKNAVITNQKLVQNQANYETNMTLIAEKYHELIDNIQNL
ncbi:glycosyltransferase family 4 protein [Flavobacterium sp. 7A]|uniref:glycosyltransferase family 4 protein n=1 Tax=Flavobacterium sp. 7A TaxID=2940571 RepID=UPI00222604D8|nr:glycosyltransferase family 4 protein [Flavobacterium sp. 7A]MCW2120198.1 glycosyltransferase involved in cell wall biosynthesis [Flavobacterium sp. 7A]